MSHMTRILMCFTLLVALLVQRTQAMTNDSATIIALVKASPQLAIDPSVPAPGEWSKKTHPYVRVVGAPEGTVGGSIDPDFAAIGIMAGGAQVMAIPLESGGSGGVFSQLIFVRPEEDAKPFYAGYITSGGHLAVNVTYHGIVAVSPHYGPNDPNCCPSKYDTTTYAIVGGKLKALSTRTTVKP
jgi:hypothetical protein